MYYIPVIKCSGWKTHTPNEITFSVYNENYKNPRFENSGYVGTVRISNRITKSDCDILDRFIWYYMIENNFKFSQNEENTNDFCYNMCVYTKGVGDSYGYWQVDKDYHILGFVAMHEKKAR